MTPHPPDLTAAHAASANHRAAVLAAARCGCFHCLAVFAPAEIDDWVDVPVGATEGATALCPRCGIDAVLPLGPGIDGAFLERMKARWF